jgi:hypothetical protein
MKEGWIFGVSEFIFRQSRNKALLPPVAVQKPLNMEESARRIGRPPKGACKRSHKVTVAFNDYEYEMMLALAESAGLRPADWCRKTAVKTRLREALSGEDRLLLKDLYKLGTNLNNLLRIMHGRRDWRYDREITQITEDFRQINNYYREVVRHGR